jgi:DNA-binding protein YbaB
MFQGIKNTAGALANANKMKAQQEKLQKLLNSVRVGGISKNGKVSVILTGDQKVVDIKIDPSLIAFVYENFTSLQKEDTLLAKSIMEAMEDATSKVQTEVVKKMQETGSLGDMMSMLQAAGG